MEEVEAAAEDVVAVMVVEVVEAKYALEAKHVAEAEDVVPINANTTIKANTVTATEHAIIQVGFAKHQTKTTSGMPLSQTR